MERQLKDLTVTEFMDVLAWPGGAPGGGALCAMNGALGTAALILVAKLTTNLKRFAEEAPLCLRIAHDTEPLMSAMIEGIDRDVDRYNDLLAAYRLSKGSEAEIAARKQAISVATLQATEAPFAILRQSLQALQLCQELDGHYNPAAASDYASAVLQLHAAAKTAWHNVLANYSGISDLARAQEIMEQGEQMHSQAMELSQKLILSAEQVLKA